MEICIPVFYFTVLDSEASVLHLENVYSGPTPPLYLQNGARIILSGTNSHPANFQKVSQDLKRLACNIQK